MAKIYDFKAHTKFLISRDGETVRRFAPTDTPESFEKDIVGLL